MATDDDRATEDWKSRAEPLRVVVTNDDGIQSAGLRLLAAAALRTGCKVLVAAPDHEASGSSAAMSAARRDGRIMMDRRKLADLDMVAAYAVRAGPAFIAFAAVREAFGRQPDFLLSGINLGPNTGQAILRSGTVGAAMTAAGHGVRAAAFSLDARGDTEHRTGRRPLPWPRRSSSPFPIFRAARS